MEDRDTLPLCIVERFHFTFHKTRMACRTDVVVSVTTPSTPKKNEYEYKVGPATAPFLHFFLLCTDDVV